MKFKYKYLLSFFFAATTATIGYQTISNNNQSTQSTTSNNSVKIESLSTKRAKNQQQSTDQYENFEIPVANFEVADTTAGHIPAARTQTSRMVSINVTPEQTSGTNGQTSYADRSYSNGNDTTTSGNNQPSYYQEAADMQPQGHYSRNNVNAGNNRNHGLSENNESRTAPMTSMRPQESKPANNSVETTPVQRVQSNSIAAMPSHRSIQKITTPIDNPMVNITDPEISPVGPARTEPSMLTKTITALQSAAALTNALRTIYGNGSNVLNKVKDWWKNKKVAEKALVEENKPAEEPKAEEESNDSTKDDADEPKYDFKLAEPQLKVPEATSSPSDHPNVAGQPSSIFSNVSKKCSTAYQDACSSVKGFLNKYTTSSRGWCALATNIATLGTQAAITAHNLLPADPNATAVPDATIIKQGIAQLPTCEVRTSLEALTPTSPATGINGLVGKAQGAVQRALLAANQGRIRA